METFEDETTTTTSATVPGANAGSTTTTPETTVAVTTTVPETTQPAPAPTPSVPAHGSCSTRIPLQKWTNIIVSQYNSAIDIYVDGKLASSCNLPGFPLTEEAAAYLCPDGGFDGYVSRLSFYNTSITQDMAREIYQKGAVYSDSTWSSIPTYVYIIVFLLIVGLVVYSMYL